MGFVRIGNIEIFPYDKLFGICYLDYNNQIGIKLWRLYFRLTLPVLYRNVLFWGWEKRKNWYPANYLKYRWFPGLKEIRWLK